MSVLALSSLLLGGCSLNNSSNEKKEGIDLANMDTTFKPGDNFYMYAIGG
ncbi:MAG: hypothetical protein GYA62_12325, partial [Bacteroidales bacterium]|nr:hypothetical protein [Bacteroidales bacterium]